MRSKKKHHKKHKRHHSRMVYKEGILVIKRQQGCLISKVKGR